MRAYSKKYYAENQEVLSATSRKRKAATRVRFQKLKRTLFCQECGENHPATLDFHHREGEVKSFTISENLQNYGWEKIKKEMAKCDVLCSNCHRKHHHDKRMES